LWGLLLTYNLVRREMLLAAEAHGLPPMRISFRSSILWIRTFWLTAWRTSPGNIPKHLGQFRSTLDVLILPVRRSERRYPRHVKIKMSNYKRNRGRRAPPGQQSGGKEP
ncbi:MAG: transposase, partial [Myxococcota bacterium]|nr:transposase [Myxococcota bacterium]